MKTICPHCNQEFPETPDEYLGMTLECPSCHRNFVCEKPKFCIECGAPNPANALQCSRCGKFFSPASETASAPHASENTSAHLHSADEEHSESQTKKSTAMILANLGSGLGFAALFLWPLCGISGIVLGIMAFSARTEREKSGWGGSSVNNRALTAIIAGLLSLLVLAADVNFFRIVRGGK